MKSKMKKIMNLLLHPCWIAKIQVILGFWLESHLSWAEACADRNGGPNTACHCMNRKVHLCILPDEVNVSLEILPDGVQILPDWPGCWSSEEEPPKCWRGNCQHGWWGLELGWVALLGVCPTYGGEMGRPSMTSIVGRCTCQSLSRPILCQWQPLAYQIHWSGGSVSDSVLNTRKPVVGSMAPTVWCYHWFRSLA